MNKSLSEKQKELKVLHQQMLKTQRQISKIMTKNMVSKIPYLLSANKWILDNFFIESNYGNNKEENCDSDSDESFQEKAILIMRPEPDVEQSNGRISSVGSSFSIPAPTRVMKAPLARSMKTPIKLTKNPAGRFPKGWDKQIKNYRDFYNLCSHFDIYKIYYNDCLIRFEYDSVKISSESSDLIFEFIKKQKISITLNSFIKNIEENDYFLRKKKELLIDLSSTMLFDH